METFKRYQEIQRMDEKYMLLSGITGHIPNLSKLHAVLEKIELHAGVPEAVTGQFNVARNMALYSHFHYAMAPEVQMKTYSVIELALKVRFPKLSKKTLSPLLKEALKQGLLKDAGFRHLAEPDPNNSYSAGLPTVLPALRNESAHGSTNLVPQFVNHIEICADLINQLFPTHSK